MADYYSVTVKATFGVLASSRAEAEDLARKLVPMDEAPVRASLSYDAYLTPNQADYLKRTAANLEN